MAKRNKKTNKKLVKNLNKNKTKSKVSKMTKITINKEVFNKLHPKLRVAFILVKNVDNKKQLKESVLLLKDAEKYAQLTYNKDNLKNHGLVSSWALLEEKQLTKAKRKHSSLEKLFHKVLTKKKITAKDVVTNVVNYLSLKEIVPMSADDYDKIKGNLSIRLANGTEKKNLRKGTLIYCDSAKKNKVLGSKLDQWKSPRTKVKPDSKNILIHVEALPPITTKQFYAVVNETVNLVKSFTGGSVKKVVLSKNKNSGEL